MKRLLAIVLIVFSSGSGADEERSTDLETMIDEYNFCESSADCANVGAYCPLGCNILVNHQHEQEVRDAIQSEGSVCMYMCVPLQAIHCVENRCTGILRQ